MFMVLYNKQQKNNIKNHLFVLSGLCRLSAAVLLIASAFLLLSVTGAADDENANLSARIVWEYPEGHEDAGQSFRPSMVCLNVTNNATNESTRIYLTYNQAYSNTSDLPLKDGDRNDIEYIVTEEYPSDIFTRDYVIENGTIIFTKKFIAERDETVHIIWDDLDDFYSCRPGNIDPENLTYESISGLTYTADSVTRNADGSYDALFQDLPTYYISGTYWYGPSYSKCLAAPGSMPNVTYQSFSEAYSQKESWNNTTKAVDLLLKLDTVTYTSDFNIGIYSSSYNGGKYQNGTSALEYAENAGIDVPETITLMLMDGDSPAVCQNQSVTFIRNSSLGWNQQIRTSWILPQKDINGTAIDYSNIKMSYMTDISAEPDTMPGQYSVSTVTNTYEGGGATQNVSALIPTILSCQFTYEWDDGHNTTGFRPDNVILKLLADGEPIDHIDMSAKAESAGDDHNITFSNISLPVLNEKGTPVKYTVGAEGLPSYYELIQESSPAYVLPGGYTDISGKEIDRIDYSIKLKTDVKRYDVNVTWVVPEGEEQNEALRRPAAVVLNIDYSSDNGATWHPFWGRSRIAQTSADPLATYWLPEHDGHGNGLTYRLTQTPLSLYETTHAVSEGSDGITTTTITNTYLTRWKYSVGLKWDDEDPGNYYDIKEVFTENTAVSKKIILSISANDDFPTGDLTVSIPYGLFTMRNGTLLSPSVIGLPQTNNSDYAFTYSLNKHDSEDQADWTYDFVNWMDFTSGTSIDIPILYETASYNIPDFTEVVLQAEGYGKSVNDTEFLTEKSNEITYFADTGFSVMPYSKELYGNTVSSDFQYGRIYQWNPFYGDRPDDFDITKYNYVVYSIRSKYPGITYSQPFTIEIEEIPGNDGKIVSFYDFQRYQIYDNETRQYIYQNDLIYDDETGTYKTTRTFPDNATATRNLTSDSRWNFVVAYERDPSVDYNTTEVIYTNTMKIRIMGTDEHEGDKESGDLNDCYETTSTASTVWKDYKWNYTGQVYGISKDMNPSNARGWFDFIPAGSDLSCRADVSSSFYGYNYENYSFELIDDIMFGTLRPIRMTEDDYVFVSNESAGGLQIALDCYDINRTDGSLIDGTPSNEPFKVYGKRGINSDWEFIGSVTMNSSRGTYLIPAELIDGRNYTGFKLVSPDGLTGRYHARMNFNITIKGGSPVITGYHETGDSGMNVYNLARIAMYEDTENGKVLISDLTEPSSYIKEMALDEEEKNEYGGYLHYNYGYTMLMKLNSSASFRKNVSCEADIDALTSRATFTLTALESVDSGETPDSWLPGFSHESGIFYDLLPLGYAYDRTKGVTVYGATSNRQNLSGGNYGILAEEPTVIDNYKGTGRQLVIFKVKSSKDTDQNIYKGYQETSTGFSVVFDAVTTNSEIVAFGKTQYNNAAYMNGNSAEMNISYSENGYGDETNKTYFATDPDGNYPLADIDGDGITDRHDTLYTYCVVTADILLPVETGISKTVKGKNAIYTTSDITNPGDDYSYRLTIETSDSGIISNVIFADILEAGIPENEISEGWKGTFKSVDTHLLSRLGIEPVIYYSTSKSIHYLTADNDEKGLAFKPGTAQYEAAGWRTTPPSDLSEVTAVLIDASKTTTGEDAEFNKATQLTVFINMTAPPELPGKTYTWNEPAFWADIRAHGSDSKTSAFTQGNMAQLEIKELQDLNFTKIAEGVGTTDKEPVPGVQFSLYMCTKSGEEGHVHTTTVSPTNMNSCYYSASPVYLSSSDANGNVSFVDLDTGSYALVETYAPEGIFRSNCWWTFEVDAGLGTITLPKKAGDASFDAVEQTENAETVVVLENVRQKGNYIVRKTWNDDAQQILRSDAVFNLYRKDAQGNEIFVGTKTIAEDASPATAVFENLDVADKYGNRYIYRTEEVCPDGYTSSAAGDASVIFSSTAAQINGTVTFTNTRLGVLDIQKQVVGDETEQTFTVNIDLKDSSGNNTGAGDYTLRRYASHEAYENGLFSNETITFDENGSASVGIKDGELLRIIGLPVNTTASVSEDDAGHEYVVSYQMSYRNSSAVYETGSNINITSDRTPVVLITNTIRPAEVTIPVRKVITGGDVEEAGDVFTFVISSTDSTAEDAPTVPPVTVTENGSREYNVSFEPLVFSKQGVYRYTVSETKGSSDFFNYDTTVYNLTVSVNKTNNGSLSAVLTSDGSAPPTVFGFTNEYRKFSLTYHMVGDDEYDIPDDAVTPSPVPDIPPGGEVNLSGKPTTAWVTSDGTADGIPGTWSFTDHWTEDSENPDKGDITDDKLTQIMADKNVYGKWMFTPTKYTVTYDVTGDAVYDIPDGGAAPTDESSPYDWKADVTVKPKPATNWTTSDGTTDGIPGTWTFTGW